MPRRPKTKLTADDLEGRLEDAIPSIVDNIVSPNDFNFWTDKEDNRWLVVGKSTLLKDKAISVRLSGKTNTDMFHSMDGIPEKLLHKNKEFTRLQVNFDPPFDCLSPFDGDTLRWNVEMAVMTMFSFVWAEETNVFKNFKCKRGKAPDILIDCMKRVPIANGKAGDKVEGETEDGDVEDRDVEDMSNAGQERDEICGKKKKQDVKA